MLKYSLPLLKEIRSFSYSLTPPDVIRLGLKPINSKFWSPNISLIPDLRSQEVVFGTRCQLVTKSSN